MINIDEGNSILILPILKIEKINILIKMKNYFFDSIKRKLFIIIIKILYF